MEKTKEIIFFFTISLLIYIFLWWFDNNKDMERYYYNTHKLKYHLLIYIKYSIFFIMIYNFKEIVMSRSMYK